MDLLPEPLSPTHHHNHHHPARVESTRSGKLTSSPLANTTQASEVLPQPSPNRQEDASSTRRRERTFRNPLSRTKSIRRDSSSSKTKPNTKDLFDRPPKTAPLQSDWQSSSDLLTAKHREKRGKSAERAIASESEDGTPVDRMATRDKFMSGSKNVMHKAKTGGGQLLNKLGKIGRTANHQVPDSEWKPSIITLPLVEQTRVTRISKDLESCRDKTEYWMPSLPWRCIDYLNLNSESEGLYRVPGSGPQVKRWQRRFDTELDVDLLDEKELYDPNTISSLLKSWLREQPTELFPSHTQVSLGVELAKANPDYNKVGQPAPQLLRDALSELPPHNYYLLFAITCHLSLLLGHTDKNKMDLHNLAVCIGPCLRMERWLFNYLVGDWRNCWQGCFTEKHFLAVEKAWEEGRDLDSDTELAGATRSLSIPENALRRHQENLHPDQSLSALPDYTHYVSGSLPNPGFSKNIVVPEIVQRPATAQGEATPETSPAAVPQRPKSHSRSHSDVPMSPTQPSSLSFPFKVRNG